MNVEDRLKEKAATVVCWVGLGWIRRRSSDFNSAAQLLLVVAASSLHERGCNGSAAWSANVSTVLV